MMLHSIFSKYKGLHPVAGLTMLAISLLCMATACDRPIRNHTLKSFSEQLSSPELTSEKASEIHRSLERISSDSLNDAERHFRSLLLIKSADKAYIEHSNDTAYLYVKDYFKSHHEELYPEVLYYGGRVYSDIGDYPTALLHFNEALDRLEDKEENLIFRATINSQTGRLLDEIRVYDQALDFIDEAIRIGKQLKDTIGMVYDLQLAGATSLRAGKISKAKGYILKAQSMSGKLDPSFIATNNMYLARASYKSGNLKEARMYIQRALPNIDSIAKNEAYVMGAEIYIKSGQTDSAYLLLKHTLESVQYINKHSAYHHLFSENMMSRIPTDSLCGYIKDYQQILERTYKLNEKDAALMQLSKYNYKVHDRKRIEAEKKQQALFYWIVGITLTAMAVIITLLAMKYRQQRTIYSLRVQLDNVRLLREQLNSKETEDKQNDLKDITANVGNREDTEDSLREKLRNEYLKLYYAKEEKTDDGVDNAIIVSSAYKMIMEKIEKNEHLTDSDKLWDRLERMILEVSPQFIDNLRLLMGGKVTQTELRTAFLIKCGFRLSHIALLCSRTDSSIASRRDTISKRIYGHKLEPKIIDGIIRLL